MYNIIVTFIVSAALVAVLYLADVQISVKSKQKEANQKQDGPSIPSTTTGANPSPGA